MEFSLGFLEFVRMPALAFSSLRIRFLMNGCEQRDCEAQDWDGRETCRTSHCSQLPHAVARQAPFPTTAWALQFPTTAWALQPDDEAAQAATVMSVCPLLGTLLAPPVEGLGTITSFENSMEALLPGGGGRLDVGCR